jgi:hypothetical protein
VGAKLPTGDPYAHVHLVLPMRIHCASCLMRVCEVSEGKWEMEVSGWICEEDEMRLCVRL